MSQYDLGFCKPAQWYDGAVITTAAIENDKTVEVQTLPDYQNLYLSFGTGNFGEVQSDAFFVPVYIDGEFYRTIEVDPLQPNSWKPVMNLELGTFAAGTHTLEMALVTRQEDETPSDNYGKTTFTVEDTGRGSFFTSFLGGDTYHLDCGGSYQLNYGKYVFSGNFIGSEAGKKVNARIELYNSHKQRVFSVTVKNGKFNSKEVVLTKDNYTVLIMSTDNQKTADRITFEITGDVFYKSDYDDNSIALVSNANHRYDVTVLDSPRTIISNGWVGLGDTLSLRRIDFLYDGKYSFTVNTTDKIKVSLIQVTTSAQNKTKVKKLASKTISAKKNFGKDIDFGGIALAKGTYYIQAEAVSAAKGTNADYSVKVGTASVFHVDCDDGSNNWLYEKKRGVNRTSLVTTPISAGTTDVYLDFNDVSKDAYDNFVGFGDAVDFAKITLSGAASVSFSMNATDASKFVIYSLIEKKNDKYTMKALQTTKLKKVTKDATEYTAVTKPLSLASGEYYISMESTNAKKGGSAYYNVVLNTDECAWLAGETLGSCIPDNLNAQDELSFAQNGLEEALGAASGAALVDEPDGNKAAWQNMLA